MPRPPTPSRIAADSVRRLRDERGWSAQRLAERCAELGAPDLNRSVIANIESGRRSYVTLEDLYVLALAFDVAPLHLMVPLDNAEPVTVAGDRVENAGYVRAWARGVRPLDGIDYPTYTSVSPAGLHRRTSDYDQRLATASRTRARAFDAAMRAQAAFDAAEAALAQARETEDEELIASARADHKAALIERARCNARVTKASERVAEIEAELDDIDRGYTEPPFDPYDLVGDDGEDL